MDNVNDIVRGEKGGRRLPPRMAAAIFCICVLFGLSGRPAVAQVFCEWPLVPPIATGIMIEVNSLAIDAILSPPDSLLAKALDEATMAVMGYTAGDVGIGAATGASGGAGGGITIPGLDQVPGLGKIVGPITNQLLSFAPISKFYGGLGFMDDIMRFRLDKFWNDFFGAMRGFSQQMYASSVNNARLLASIDDVGGMSANAVLHADVEINAKKQHQVSNQSCQFDTTAQSMRYARATSVAAGVGMAQEFNDVTHNTKGTPGAAGPHDYHKYRFQLYLNKFCDVTSNGGQSPCAVLQQERQGPPLPGMSLITPAQAAAPVALPKENASVAIGDTLFGNDTIDGTDSDMVTALHEMTCNLIDCTAPSPIAKAVLDTAQGDEQLQRNREYSTQIDALTALVSDVIGDRMPAADPNNPSAGQNIQDVRTKQGVPNPSETPSMHEVLMSVINQLNDPNYYADLGDAGGTIGQKEVYLKAYNNMLLFRLIEKQEKLAGAYAIQTANMLKKTRGTHDQQYGETPLQGN
jgi:hypothetical protein